MNFLEVRNNLAHMLSEDPLGIDNPFTHDGVNHESLDMTSPVDNISCNWKDDHVEIYDQKRDNLFRIAYEGRGEAKVAAEVTKILTYLSK